MAEEPVSEPLGVWNARDLCTIGLVLLGVWWIGSGIDFVRLALFSGEGIVVAFAAIPLWVLGAVVILGAGSISRRLARSGEIASTPEVSPLLAAGIALIGVVTVVSHGYALVRLVLPFTAYDQRTPIPSGAIAADLVIVALGVFLFVRARFLADLWARWNARS